MATRRLRPAARHGRHGRQPVTTLAAMLGELLDSFIAEDMEESPTRATALGIDGHDDRLGEYSAADFERRAKNDDAWLERFRSIPDRELDLDGRIDRDLAVSSLVGRQLMRDWGTWRRDPATYVGPCMSGVFSLFLNRVHPEPDLVRFAAARLRAVPGVPKELCIALDDTGFGQLG